MEAYTLFEVNQHIKQVLALNFQEPIWIECEIAQAKESRGQIYLELIEKEENSDNLLAKCSAVIWFKQYLFIKKKLGELVDSIINDGVKVKLKANIEFHEKFGLKLVVEDIDPTYSLGVFELARQKIIERLKKEDRLHLNSSLNIPMVIQKIAVISSSKAAGYQDFYEQLSENMYAYQFELSLFSAAMQGANTEREIVSALKDIHEDSNEYDIIVITRGGGSKIDLASFDNYKIAFAISKSEIPVFTGIGHDIDETVADIVAHSVLKTPTAVANFIIDHNMQAEAEFLELEKELIAISQNKISEIKFDLQSIGQMLVHQPLQLINQKYLELALIENTLESDVQNHLSSIKDKIENIEDKLELLKPENILKKGYTLISQKKNYISSVKKLDTSNAFTVNFRDGKIEVEKK